MKKKVIGIDFDDVLMDFVPGFLSFVSKKIGKTFIKEDIKNFFFWGTLGLSKEEAVALCEEYYQTDAHLNSLPVKRSKEALEKLANFSLHVVTARPTFTEDVTRRWTKHHFKDSIEQFHFTNGFKNNQAVSKGALAKELGVSYFVDDAPHNAFDVASEGIPVFLLDAPWNQDTGYHPCIARVYNWDEIIEHIVIREVI